MKHTKLIIKHIEVEGSAETITSLVKSLQDLFPGNGEPNKYPGPKVQKAKKAMSIQEVVEASRRASPVPGTEQR